MRVLHVVQALARSFGGPQTVLHDLVRAQYATGIDVDVVSTNVDAPHGVLEVEPNRFTAHGGARLRYSSVEFRPLLLSMDFRNYVRESISSYDIVHIHGLYRFPPTYAAYQARKQGVPYIIRPYGSLDPYLYGKSTSGSVTLKRIYERLFDLPNLNAADAIHYTTEEERDRAAFLRLRSPSFVIPNGLDWEQYRVLPSRGKLRIRWGLGDARTVLFLGRLHFKKGLDLLIEAFDEVRVRVPGVQLVIAGPDNHGYESKVRSWVRERGLEAAVHFVGPVYGRDVVQAYVDADVFVLPSYTENFGMTVAEAMACGVPVVVSDQVNIHHDVEGAGAGLVTRCDRGDVAAALEALLEDVDRRHAMGKAGRQLVQERFTWLSIVERLTNEYAGIIDRHRRTGSQRRKAAAR